MAMGEPTGKPKKKGRKKVCCNCMNCKCSCHKEKEGFLGRVQLSMYEYEDGTHDVKITFNRYDDLPNPAENKRGFTVMGLLAAQVQDTAKKQLKAIDMLIVGKDEMRVMDAEAQKEMADVDQLQTKFDFEEDIKNADG